MTDSMMVEQRRRILWSQTVQDLIRTHVVMWPDIKGYYIDRYTPREAAMKYLNSIHRGENS